MGEAAIKPGLLSPRQGGTSNERLSEELFLFQKNATKSTKSQNQDYLPG